MKIVIPMSGIGKRFIDAGYADPKPLIKADGKPIVEHVINLFPGEKDFIFICNKNHLMETEMETILKRIAPHGEIIAIPSHKKGPVYAVSHVFEMLGDEEEIIVNYCDFSKYWDYQDFLRHTRLRSADGAIPAYKGFHPHMLGTTNYAFMRDCNQWMLEIREKQPFTDNRMNEYASDGTYYFRKGEYVKKYFKQLMEEDLNVNGEYYVSMVYNLLRRDSLRVSIYEVQHMLQWGTPRDLEEYQRWSDYFAKLILPCDNIVPKDNSINLIPLAGRGKRFAEEGYNNPKPLIEVSGKPMIIQASDYLPQARKHIFICLEEHLLNYPLEREIRKVYPDAKVLSLGKVTEGQACTCEIGLEGENLDYPLLIGACDNGMLWNKDKYEQLINDSKVDAVAWSFRRHPSSERNPQMYGWIKVDGDENVTGVSVKKAISEDPYNDHAIVGTFYFKKTRFFVDALKRMYERNIRVNGEFYVDSCLNELVDMGLCVKVFEVDDYICWGTPNDLRTYEYWQSFFYKCNWHPYCLDRDSTLNPAILGNLNERFRNFKQEHQ